MNLGKVAIIGNSGFVGSNLAMQLLKSGIQTKGFNSMSDTHELYSNTWDNLIIAAPSAVKWLANLNPLEDAKNIDELVKKIEATKSSRQYLFSTLDVYAKKNQNESDTENFEKSQAYGRNRRNLEEALLASCKNLTIIRLPALFGIGLKKNIFYDLLNKNQLEKVSMDAIFQWYPISRLLEDLIVITENEIKLVNLVSEPLETSIIVNEVFPEVLEIVSRIANSQNQIRYQCESIHASFWSNSKKKYMFESNYIIKLMKQSREIYEQVSL